MRRGTVIGAIAGVVFGLVFQLRGGLTGMAVRSLSPEGAHALGIGFVAALFVAALGGIIGAFAGAFVEEMFSGAQ